MCILTTKTDSAALDQITDTFQRKEKEVHLSFAQLHSSISF